MEMVQADPMKRLQKFPLIVFYINNDIFILAIGIFNNEFLIISKFVNLIKVTLFWEEFGRCKSNRAGKVLLIFAFFSTFPRACSSVKLKAITHISGGVDNLL